MPVFKNDHLILEKFEVGPYLVNAYVLTCVKTGKCAVIDPGEEGEYLLQHIKDQKWEVQFIVNTHGHMDHIYENGYFKEKTGAPIIIHSLDAPMLTDARLNMSAFFTQAWVSPPADQFFQEGVPFQVGELVFNVLHTPGHSPGSICLVNAEIAIVGDVLFYDSVGRSDFPGGSHDLLIRSIREKLLPLGDEVQVFCGHGPNTTVGRERRENPFLNDWGF